jgi:hypothetical protein
MVSDNKNQQGRTGLESPEELPYKLYSAREVAIEMDVSQRFILAIRKFGVPRLLG